MTTEAIAAGEALEPCPFCGGSEIDIGGGEQGEDFTGCWSCLCAKCLAEGPLWNCDTREEAIAAWNTRTALDAVGDVASAVAAEKERCATIAREECLDICTASARDLEVVRRTRDAIYAAIRSPAPAQPDMPCTCHPDDNPPKPCPKRYALQDCIAAAHPQGGKDNG